MHCEGAAPWASRRSPEVQLLQPQQNGAGSSLGSHSMRIRAAWESDKSVLLQLLRFPSLFWFHVATKGKAFECCLQHKHVSKHLILGSASETQPSSFQSLKWQKTAFYRERRACVSANCILFALPFTLITVAIRENNVLALLAKNHHRAAAS